MRRRARSAIRRATAVGTGRDSPQFRHTIIASSVALALAGAPYAHAQWKPNAEVFVKPGDRRSYLGVEGVIPLWQTGTSLLFGDLPVRLMMGVVTPPDAAEIRRRAEAAADAVLRLYPVARSTS